MSALVDPNLRDAVEARLRFYRELGVGEYYRRPVDAALMAALGAATVLGSASVVSSQELPLEFSGVDPVAAKESVVRSDSNFDHSQEADIPPRKPFPAPPEVMAALLPEQHAPALQQLREEIGDCTRCKLHTGRNKLVFGDGDANARLMFVGEGPGADEDAQGIPFVGRGGQLLNNMIGAMGLRRDEVYIANVVKCRPPANRTPEPDEGHTCSPFLFRQIDIVRPEVIVALGQTAVTYLTGEKRSLSAWRGAVHSLRASKLIVTFHPAYLLRDPNQKKFAWADLQIAMRELGLKAPIR
uniref:Type-4 uracil-DNA glycosylase n=1 Tax=mine drainage metagenome TaxID=410659 RepID=E6QP37_9ZZZZ